MLARKMIKNFTIYGERCSGVDLLEATMIDNFNLPPTWEYGDKYCFGLDDNSILKDEGQTLFLSIVRHPYDWLNCLFKRYLESSNITETKNNLFSGVESLFNEWGSVVKYIESKNSIASFLFDSCYCTDYEIPEDLSLKYSKRYANIFDLRRDKLNYLYYTLSQLTQRYMIIRYEDLYFQEEKVVEEISNRFNLSRNYQNPIEKEIVKYDDRLVPFAYKINKSIDWEAEYNYFYTPQRINYY